MRRRDRLGSNMHGLKSGSCRFWQRTDLPPGSNMLRAEIQRALRRAPRQLRRLRLGLQTHRGSNQSAAHVSESNSRSNVFQISRVCVPSRWKVLSGEFRRRPTTLAIKFRKPDRVGRRGLSEPREDFSRLPTNSFPRLCPWLYPWLYPQPLFHPNFAAPLFDDTNNRRILP